MKRLFRFIFCIVTALSAAACTDKMDPYEGGDGVRVNINGHACVMIGEPGKTAATYDAAARRFSTSVNLERRSDGARYTLQLEVTDDSPLLAGQKYFAGTGGCKAVLSYVYNDVNENDIVLTGWIQMRRISTESKTVEASFDLEGSSPGGTTYSLRHGFLRLYTNINGAYDYEQ